ncbi:MAG: ribonuclease H-like domain-containing protein [Armatimonadota bacterium]
MLEKTFCHVEGVGYRTERRLWTQGADCWRTFLDRPTDFKVSRARLAPMLATLTQSETALQQGRYRFFGERLPSREHWRALRAFPSDRIAYLDIETDGGTDFDSVTVIGLARGGQLHQFVRGENLLEFPEALDDVALLVTFYGGGFDIPVLRRAFPRLPFDQLHLDLCPTLRRLGLSGGLKSIERQLGMARGEETTGLSGWDAVRLWSEWRRGREESLHTLLSYNAEDVLNMAPLADYAYTGLSSRILEEELR